jgi:hypothetical protein
LSPFWGWPSVAAPPGVGLQQVKSHQLLPQAQYLSAACAEVNDATPNRDATRNNKNCFFMAPLLLSFVIGK